MGSLLCCLRGSPVEEDGDSNENEQIQDSNNTANRSTTQAGLTLFTKDFTKMVCFYVIYIYGVALSDIIRVDYNLIVLSIFFIDKTS